MNKIDITWMDMRKNLSYRNTPVTTSLMYSTVKDRLEILSEKIPDKKACVVYDLDGTKSSITCSNLYQKACFFAKGLLKLGIKKGDIVAQSLPNGPNWMISTFGIQLAGAAPLMFMFYLKDGSDICSAFKKTENCTAVLFDPGDDDVNWDISRHFIEDVRENGIAASSQVPTLKYVFLSRRSRQRGNAFTIDDILRLGEQNSDIKLPKLDPDDLATIFLTSGSTGKPKAVQYTHLQLIESGLHLSSDLDVKENDIYFNMNSFNWMAAYPHLFLFKGTTRVTCSRVLMFKSLDELISMIINLIVHEKCTIAMLSVPVIHKLTENYNGSYEWACNIKTVIATGVPIPSTCSKILRKFGKTFVCTYGSTELGYISTLHLSKDEHHENFSVGIPLPGREMKIVNDSGEILPVNETGELYVRHCIKHLGYHNDIEMTNKVFTPTGWYKTDDVGCMKEDGTFIVSGRISDMIIVGEDLVSPLYLENIILRNQEIQDVVVIPIVDDQMFQQPCACIIPKKGKNVSEENLRDFFRREFAIISAYRGFVPKYYLFFDEFPKTPLGKLSRKLVLRMAYERLNKL